MKQKKNWDVVISRIGSIASIVGLFTIFFSDGIAKKIAYGFVGLYIVAMTIFIIYRYFSIRQITQNIEDEFNNKLIELGEHTHTITHGVRDRIAEITNSDRANRDNLKNIVINCCDSISNYYNELLECPVNVCIKEIKTDTILNDDVTSWDIMTLGRSTSSKQERSNIDHKPCKVTDNTDFEIILTEGKSDWFASPNLTITVEKYNQNSDGKKFKNSRDGFLDFYQSTIVVPIRIHMGKIAKNLYPYGNEKLQSERMSFHVLGFLCIDSMNTFDENDKRFKCGIEQAKAFADILYPLLEAFLVAKVKQQ